MKRELKKKSFFLKFKNKTLKNDDNLLSENLRFYQDEN